MQLEVGNFSVRWILILKYLAGTIGNTCYLSMATLKK
jgi:hypothetical protein